MMMIDQWMEWDTDGYSTLSSQTNTYNTNYNTNYCENVVADIPIEVLVCTSSIGSRRNVIQNNPNDALKGHGPKYIFRMSWNTRSPGFEYITSLGLAVNCLVFLQLDPRMARMPSTMRRPETTPPGSRLYLVAHVCKFPCISYCTYTLHLVVHGEESWSSKWQVRIDNY
jgi:hypothetical protein